VISGKLQSENQYSPDEIAALIETLMGLDEPERDQLLRSIPDRVFVAIALEPCESSLTKFLPMYREMLDRIPHPDFSYAEVVAERMKGVVKHCKVASLRADALVIAIRTTDRLNRFAAKMEISHS
jgi:hypothetical protein